MAAIFGLFFQIGLLSFGGGLSAWIYREIVEKRRWLAPADFFSGLALGQVLPGINTANLSIYVGGRLRGIPGAALALIGLLTAPFFIIIGLTAVYARISAVPWVHYFLRGVATAAVGLILSVPLRSMRSAMHGTGPYVILLVTILTVGVLHWPILPVVLCVTPPSVALAWRTRGDKSAR